MRHSTQTTVKNGDSRSLLKFYIKNYLKFETKHIFIPLFCLHFATKFFKLISVIYCRSIIIVYDIRLSNSINSFILPRISNVVFVFFSISNNSLSGLRYLNFINVVFVVC